jgi:hypothetical protein
MSHPGCSAVMRIHVKISEIHVSKHTLSNKKLNEKENSLMAQGTSTTSLGTPSPAPAPSLPSPRRPRPPILPLSLPNAPRFHPRAVARGVVGGRQHLVSSSLFVALPSPIILLCRRVVVVSFAVLMGAWCSPSVSSAWWSAISALCCLG